MREERAVSVTVSYTLTLVIATLLIGGLLASTGGLIETQSELAVQEELDVIGNTLASNLESADRLVDVGAYDANTSETFEESDIEVGLDVTLPDRVAGTTYTIDVTVDSANDTSAVVLRSHSPEVEVTVPFVTTYVSEEQETLRGGDVVIVAVDGELEVRNA